MIEFDKTKISTDKEVVENYMKCSKIIIKTEFDKWYDEVMKEEYAKLHNTTGFKGVSGEALSIYTGEPSIISLPWSIVIGKMFDLSEEGYLRYKKVEKFRTYRKNKKMYKYC